MSSVTKAKNTQNMISSIAFAGKFLSAICATPVHTVERKRRPKHSVVYTSRRSNTDSSPTSSDAEKQANLALLETDASRPATMDAVKSAVFTQPPALTAEERKQRILDSAEGRSAPPEVPSTSVASSSPLPVVMATAVAEAAAGMATMDISDAPPALTAEERKQRILDQLHPPSKKLTASAALDAEMTETVKTIAERSGMDAVAIAAMLSLDVDAVRAVLAAP